MCFGAIANSARVGGASEAPPRKITRFQYAVRGRVNQLFNWVCYLNLFKFLYQLSIFFCQFKHDMRVSLAQLSPRLLNHFLLSYLHPQHLFLDFIVIFFFLSIFLRGLFFYKRFLFFDWATQLELIGCNSIKFLIDICLKTSPNVPHIPSCLLLQ